MQNRVHKLLVLVGEQGVQLEARDYKKLSEVIVNEYLSQNNLSFKNFLHDFVVRVIRLIPQKQHFYAGLTAAISWQQNELSSRIIESVLHALQTDINNGRFQESLNILNYLSELTNISLLNSLTFMNVLEDVLGGVEKEVEGPARRSLLLVLIKSLPLYAYSLNEKIYHQFRKYIEKLRKLGDGQELCEYIYGLFSKSILKDYSYMRNLQSDFSNLTQFHSKIKLVVDFKLSRDRDQIDYYAWARNDHDPNYREFRKKEGLIHKVVLEQLIESFYKNGSVLVLKVINFIKIKEDPSLRHLVEILLTKALRSRKPIVECALLSALAGSEQTASAGPYIQEALLELFNLAEGFQLGVLLGFARISSILINNWKGEWPWDKFSEGEEGFLKRAVLLKIILEKLTLLNDKYITPKSLKKFEPAKPITNEEEYKSVQDLEVLQRFSAELKAKTEASKLLATIDSEKKYGIFLQALFRRTSLSQTHLNVLTKRYSEIILAFTKEDWGLINKIRNFFRNSFFHRLYYLRFMIQKKLLDYPSYIKYVGELTDKSEIDMIWLKVELNELNVEFGWMIHKVK